MAEVKVEDEIAASLEEVWALVSDFVGFVQAQGVSVTGDGEGVGMTRTVTVGSMEVVERLESLDEATHTTSYSIVSAPLPVRDFLATIHLEAGGADSTRLSWRARFEPVGAEDETVAMMERTYRGGVKAIKRHFAG